MRLLTLGFSLFLCVCLLGQSSEFTPEEWTQIEHRWLESQPVIKAYTRSGVVVSGQQIHASNDSIFIYPGMGLPVGSDWQKELVSLHVNEIGHALFQPGGNKLGRKKKAGSITFPSSDARYSEAHVELRSASVYVDSLYSPPVLEEAFVYSEVLQKAYRQKRLRLSFGINFGGDVLSEEMRKAIDDSGLPFSSEGWTENVNLELLDVSVRFFDRLILGGSFFSRQSFTSVYGYFYNEIRDMSYDYQVDYTEHRLYTEYALLNTDRYFLRKYELIAGAGLLFGSPEWRFSYRYYDVQNPDYETDPNHYFSHSERMLGLQLKGAFHYYIFPGLSFWTGLDVNLNQPFVVPEIELPTTGNGENLMVPEHELGFSGVRFKLGLSLYL